MRIGFVINSIATEQPEYTTVRLALVAARKGHDTWMMGVDDFSHRADGTVAAHARSAADNHPPPRKRSWRASKTTNTVATTSRSTISKCW